MGKAIFGVEKIPAFVKSGVAVVGTFRFGKGGHVITHLVPGRIATTFKAR
jgi:hypothetical protein